MPKWEYCAVFEVRAYEKRGLSLCGESEVLRFTAQGPRHTTLEHDSPNALAQAIAQLGEEGWEMVACGNTRDWLHVIYFKRPKA